MKRMIVLSACVLFVGGCSFRDLSGGGDDGEVGPSVRGYRQSQADYARDNASADRDFRQGQYQRDLDNHLSNPSLYPAPRSPGGW